MIVDLKNLLTQVIAIARQAGEVQLRYFRGNSLDIQSKFNDSDVVTAADKASEKAIVDFIKTHYPSHSILSEEMGSEQGASDYRWIIDPLDGTTNFSNGLPSFSVSIGIEYCGEMVIGVVYAPYLNELFYAVKGQGAFLNGRHIAPSAKSTLSQAVIATGFPVDKDCNPDNNLDNVTRVLPLVRGLRRLGSAAIDLCYVAAGFLDGYWELNLHEWDVAAARLIVEEAGGIYASFREGRNISVVAAAPMLYSQLSPLLR